MLTKESLRKRILKKTRNQKEDIRFKKSSIIKKKLFKTREFKKAKVILFYMSFDGEVQTKDMIKDSIKEGKTVLLPVCKTRTKQIIPSRIWGLKRKDFCLGPYKIMRPKKINRFPIGQIDLVVAPGVAFDKKGRRLGRGQGYYDRFLKKISDKAHSIGLAFNFQIVKKIPRISSFDLSVDKVIFA